MAEIDPATMFARIARRDARHGGADGAPHVVPVVFAVHADREAPVVYTAVDAKRKSTRRLRRLTNIEANPRVSMLVDHYDADRDQLWWVRADGLAEIHQSGEEMAVWLRPAAPQIRSVPTACAGRARRDGRRPAMDRMAGVRDSAGSGSESRPNRL